MSGETVADRVPARERVERRARRPPTPEEKRALAYWLPLAIAIGVVEILGAVSGAVRDVIPWPTISSTIGHLGEQASWVGVVVVAVITVAAALAARTRSGRDWADPDRPMESDPSTMEPLQVNTKGIPFRYGWPTVLVLTGVIAFVVHLIDDDKYVLGYAIYGSFLVFGIVIPIILVHREHRATGFPSLLVALSGLTAIIPITPLIVLAGLAILVLHLALYPWPDLTRESASYAGLRATAARARAVSAVKQERVGRPPLVQSAQTRGIVAGEEAWLVYFRPESGVGDEPYSGCVVTVTEEDTSPSPECSQ